MKALIVEDGLTNRLFLKSFLAPYGECHVALNGREGVKAFREALEAQTPYDLICMDVMMPEMDGHEAVRIIRAFESTHNVLPAEQVKIIMTTALNDPENVIISAHEKCDAYLVKPINGGRLLNHLESFGLLKEKPKPTPAP